ncbi:MAG: hypothetical protein ACE15D_16905 [Candidatus Eisenbacteria bacterium]
MAIKQGDSVTNSKCSQWGTGVVLSIGPSSAEVRFPTVGPKRLLKDVLLPSSERATVLDKKGKKVDPEFQARLKELVEAFATAANHEMVESMKVTIYEAFLGSGTGKATIKRQLAQWIRTNPHGRQHEAHAGAQLLYDFLFPESPQPKKDR